ncbi:MAG: hypothetical protein IIT63_02610 [Prevotella sp.]|nr:hypothetical protein [Prevotella sp.]
MKKILTINASVELEVPEDFENIDDVISTSENASNGIKFLKENGWDVDVSTLETKEERDKRLKEEKRNYVPKISEIKYIRVRAGVRYWEDTDVNGEEDDDDNPRMPLVQEIDGEKNWVFDIDIKTGKIKDWPKGTTAETHYKTCDDNTISFIGHNGKVLREVDCYVPGFLAIEDSGYGDYIIINIDGDGKINDFRFNEDDIEEIINDAF